MARIKMFSKIVPVLLVIIAATALTGCKATYTHNFTVNQSLAEGELSWTNSGTDFSFSNKGLYIEDASFSSPVAFSGDFECTFEIETVLPATDTDYVDFSLFMINGSSASYDEYVGIDVEYYDISTVRHKITQGPDPIISDNRSWGPDNMNASINEITISRSGNFVTVSINGTITWGFELSAGNAAEHFRPYIEAFHSGFEPGAGFYLRKVTVEYEKGNSV